MHNPTKKTHTNQRKTVKKKKMKGKISISPLKTKNRKPFHLKSKT